MRAAARDRRDGRLGAAGGGGKKDNRIGPRACEQDRGDIGYQPCSRFQAAGPARFELGATPTFPTLSSTLLAHRSLLLFVRAAPPESHLHSL